jgi:hypothetical protein
VKRADSFRESLFRLKAYLSEIEEFATSTEILNTGQIWNKRTMVLPGEWRGFVINGENRLAIRVEAKVEHAGFGCMLFKCEPPNAAFHICAFASGMSLTGGACFEPPRLYEGLGEGGSVFMGGFPEDLALGGAYVEAEMQKGTMLTLKIKGKFGGKSRDVKIVLERQDGASKRNEKEPDRQ